MLSLFQREFRFRGLVFTNTQNIISLAKRLNVKTVSRYPVNPYHMPYIREMYVTAKQTFSSRYYGYINSDILLSPNIMDVIKIAVHNVQLGKLNPIVRKMKRMNDNK